MKKTLVLMASAAMLLLGASCTKEGVFNPKEKIAKISESELQVYTSSYDGQSYTESDTTPKHVTQEWKWDDNLLTTITNYHQEQGILDDQPTTVVSSVLTLTYDGKQLVKVSDASGQDYSNYTYDGNKLTKIESYEEGQLRSTAEITHDGKKIAQVVVTTYEVEDKASDATRFALSTIMPNKRVLDKVLANSAKATTTQTQTLDFTFDGGNVTKIDMTYGEENITLEYTYDKNKNPFYGCYAALGEEGFTALSENNILSEKSTEVYTRDGATRTYTYTTNYEYEYDGKFPTTVSTTSTYTSDNYSEKRTHTTYYEYAE